MSTTPRYAYESALLAMVAADIHAQRVAHYPAAVARGVLTLEQAAAGIRIAAAVEADWRRVMDPALPRDRGASKTEKIATLTTAAARSAELAAKQPDDWGRAEYAEFVQTLLWWESRTPDAQAIVEINLEARRRYPAPTIGKAA